MPLARRIVAPAGLAPGGVTTAPSPVITIVCTSRADGDMPVDQASDVLSRRRRALIDLPWAAARQVHGSRVVTVSSSLDASGVEADALMTDQTDLVLAVQTADCVPVALVGEQGTIAVAHAGWRGLVGGVLCATVGAMRDAGENRIRGYIGPSICPRHYEFSPADLEDVVAVLGSGVRSSTAEGKSALDVRSATISGLSALGVASEPFPENWPCTAELPSLYSHRGAGDRGRQSMAIWKQEP